MSTVTVFTAARMQEIEDGAIIGGSIVGDNLILEAHDGSTVNAGDVRGPQGDQGDPGEVTYDYLEAYLPKYTNSTDLLADVTSQQALIYLNASYRYVLARRQGVSQTWVATLGPVTYSKTTDELGAYYFNATDFGFVNIVGSHVEADWAADFDSIQFAQSRIVAGDVQARAFYVFADQSTAFGAVVPAAEVSVSGSITVTGKWE